jgi:hypothetical protein
MALLLDARGPVALEATAFAGIHAVTYRVFDDHLEGPDAIPSGLVTIRITNQGRDLHQLQLIKLAEGKTAEDLSGLKRSPADILPLWAKYAGGPNITVPGKTSEATLRLEKGNYILICFVRDENGIPHMARGLWKPLTVEEAEVPPAEDPAADLTIEMSNYAIKLSEPIRSGRRSVRVENHGTQPHEILVVRLSPDESARDFAASLKRGVAGPLPGEPIGGLALIEKREEAIFTAVFDPGRYALICLKTDPSSGKPHFVLGMIQELQVN